MMSDDVETKKRPDEQHPDILAVSHNYWCKLCDSVCFDDEDAALEHVRLVHELQLEYDVGEAAGLYPPWKFRYFATLDACEGYLAEINRQSYGAGWAKHEWSGPGWYFIKEGDNDSPWMVLGKASALFEAQSDVGQARIALKRAEERLAQRELLFEQTLAELKKREPKP
jgi:hypothetical protein